MDFEGLYSKLVNTFSKNRPAETSPVVLISSGDEQTVEDSNLSPLWQKSTKKTVIIVLLLLAAICLFFLRSMITPFIFSCLMVFYLKPVVLTVETKWNVSHKWSVIIVFVLFLVVAIGIIALGGYSIYGQTVNFLELLNNSVDNLPDAVLEFLGGPESSLGKLFAGMMDSSQNSELNEQLKTILRGIAGGAKSFVQSFSSKIGWFFFVYGFSFFICWEMKEPENERKNLLHIPGYDHDIEMGSYHLTLIWRRFLWGQMMLLLISLVVYSVLYVILGVRYAFILAIAVGLTRMIPYIGSFFAWGAVALVTLFQGPTIFGMQPLGYAVMVVTVSFLIDKFMDGFIQPKFLAETLKVHPAAVLTGALICGRSMGFLGIFLSAPLVATLKLVMRYILRKLRDEDPWENIETVAEPVPVHEYLEKYKVRFHEFYDKLHDEGKNLMARMAGGKDHGSKRC